jgi:cytochrome c-type protein NapB
VKINIFFILIPVILTSSLIACSGFRDRVSQEAGLVEGQPGENVYPSAQPGETDKLPRAYDIAPPVIPHNVLELKVSRDSNDCLGCHLEGAELGQGHVATKVPKSHYMNAHTGERKEDGPVGIRYNCLQCHVPQAKGEPHIR